MPAVTPFTEEFARILRSFVDGSDVSRQAVANLAGRSRAFVSDQLLGKRAVDTDVLAAIAEAFEVSPRFLVRQVMDQMPSDLVGIPGLNSAADVQAKREQDDLKKRRARGGVSGDDDNIEDLIGLPSAAQPKPRNDVEGTEESPNP